MVASRVVPRLQDLAVFDSDIKDSIDGLRGINDVALFEQQVVDHVCGGMMSQFKWGTKEQPQG